MTNILKFFSTIVLVAVIGFIFVACEGPTGPQGAQGEQGPATEEGEQGELIAIEIAFLPDRIDFALDGVNLTGLRVNNVYTDGRLRRTTDFTYSKPLINRGGSFPVTVTSTIDETLQAHFDIRIVEPRRSQAIIILQANRLGNNNGGAGGFPRTLVELFNLTDEPIDLAGGNYYLHIRNATTWTHAIPLIGTIPARSSFLIASTSTTDINTAPSFANAGNPMGRADLPAADKYAAFTMPSGNFVVALLVNQPRPLDANVNPFTEESLWPYYIDMLGTTSSVFEGSAAAPQSAPQGPRRISLDDTNNNGADFSQADFRGQWVGTDGRPNNQLYRIWPRNSGAGVWNPMTGIPAVHPTVRNPTTGVIEFPPELVPPPGDGTFYITFEQLTNPLGATINVDSGVGTVAVPVGFTVEGWYLGVERIQNGPTLDLTTSDFERVGRHLVTLRASRDSDSRMFSRIVVVTITP